LATSESKQADEDVRAEFIRWLRLLGDENEVVKDFNGVSDTAYPMPPHVGDVETERLRLAICCNTNRSSGLEVTIGGREPEVAHTVAYENERK
jgi:hypothetical protein